MRPFSPLLLAAWHEAGHTVAAMHYRLRLREVRINDDGSGRTTYEGSFGVAEARDWTVATYAGHEAERTRFLYYRGDRSDLIAIDEMLKTLRLYWTEDKLTELRREAQHLVRCQRSRIRTVADLLVEHRHLSADDLRWMRATTPPARPVFASV